MTIKDRILEFVKTQDISVRSFCSKVGINNALLSPSAMNSKFKTDKVFNILNIYPELSAEWLLRGEGEMIRKVEPEAPSCATQEILTLIKSLNDKIDNMSSQIEELKKTDARPDEDAVCAAAG